MIPKRIMQRFRSGSPHTAVMAPLPLSDRSGTKSEIVFFKTRMRRALRGIIASAQPAGLRPPAGETAARALTMERAAIAFGVTWRGLSPAQAAIVIVHAARIVAGEGTAEATRLAAAADRFALTRGLAAFSGGIAQDIARSERLAALRRHGHVLPLRRPLAGPALPA